MVMILGAMMVGVFVLAAVCWTLHTKVEELEYQILKAWYRVDAQQLEILGLIEERHGAEAADALSRSRAATLTAMGRGR